MIGAFGGFDRNDMAVCYNNRLADIERSQCVDQSERAIDINSVAVGWPMMPQHAFRHEQFGRDVFHPDDAQAPAFGNAGHPDNNLSSPPRKKRITRGSNLIVCQSSRSSLSGGRKTVPMNNTSRQFSAFARRKKRPAWPIAIQ